MNYEALRELHIRSAAEQSYNGRMNDWTLKRARRVHKVAIQVLSQNPVDWTTLSRERQKAKYIGTIKRQVFREFGIIQGLLLIFLIDLLIVTLINWVINRMLSGHYKTTTDCRNQITQWASEAKQLVD